METLTFLDWAYTILGILSWGVAIFLFLFIRAVHIFTSLFVKNVKHIVQTVESFASFVLELISSEIFQGLDAWTQITLKWRNKATTRRFTKLDIAGFLFYQFKNFLGFYSLEELLTSAI